MPSSTMLAEHGTQLMVLKPSSVRAAAAEDIRRRDRNREKTEVGDLEYEQFAFHRRHVSRSENANDLMVLALMDPAPGRQSGKLNTRLLYSDSALLLAAIRGLA